MELPKELNGLEESRELYVAYAIEYGSLSVGREGIYILYTRIKLAGTQFMFKIRDPLLSLINECVEVLNRESNGWKYKLYGTKNLNKCGNKLVHMLELCTKLYQLIYRSLCEKRVEYYSIGVQISKAFNLVAFFRNPFDLNIRLA